MGNKFDRLIRKIVKAETGDGRWEIGLKFVGDKEIRKLNKKFRKIDKATDVLSFEMNEDSILGDVVISKETAKRNAKRFKVSLNDEIKRLVIHGILHLLGYDHIKPQDRKKMRMLESKYFNL